MQTKFTRAALGGFAGIVLLATAAPAIARDTDPKTERSAAAKSTKANGHQRYCADTEVTGSRLKRRTCMTASEWSAQGVDIVKEAQKGPLR